MARAKLGNVVLDVVESEDPTFDNEVTDFPVERGEDVSDHVKNKPVSLLITGVCVGPESPKKLGELRKYRNTRTLLTYIGRNIFKDFVMTNLSTKHDKGVRNGFSFSITLREVRIAITKQVVVPKIDPVTQKKTTQQVKKPTNKGRQQPQKRSVKKQDVVERAAAANRKTVFDGLG